MSLFPPVTSRDQHYRAVEDELLNSTQTRLLRLTRGEGERQWQWGSTSLCDWCIHNRRGCKLVCDISWVLASPHNVWLTTECETPQGKSFARCSYFRSLSPMCSDREPFKVKLLLCKIFSTGSTAQTGSSQEMHDDGLFRGRMAACLQAILAPQDGSE